MCLAAEFSFRKQLTLESLSLYPQAQTRSFVSVILFTKSFIAPFLTIEFHTTLVSTSAASQKKPTNVSQIIKIIHAHSFQTFDKGTTSFLEFPANNFTPNGKRSWFQSLIVTELLREIDAFTIQILSVFFRMLNGC